MPSPWVTRAIAKELPAKELSPMSPASQTARFIAESAQHLTGGRIGDAFVCWRALVTGDCPFGHEWQPVSAAAPLVDLPLATYGGAAHLRLSDDAWVTYEEEQNA